ncbi:peptide deformylase [Candidatus Woesebacteria bacterium]|nr:peptide deformylase [Candidatus Woesebacteria bacterium]MCD8507299.1 peptide deformylase [Candidatus Woesebacteria bacterium]MCD8527015.1 peptide deformylase [Candidatus Woesebacteria bacterium]MCD8546748.1 peptide deformylase [Candidatus Woesebacteria bacterium]
MKSADIVRAPHKALRTVSDPITAIDAKVKQYLETLQYTLQHTNNPPGVGLAAPQIDKPYRAFTTQLENPHTDRLQIRLYLNPRITDVADKQVVGTNPRNPDLEGCLSIPFLYGPVKRPEWVTLTWQEMTTDGQLTDWHTETFFDFPARVIQHELDHLNGVLFTDYILEQGQPLYREDHGDLFPVKDLDFIRVY